MSTRLFLPKSFMILAAGMGTVAHAQPCTPRWEPRIGQPGMNNAVYALCGFDDGIGPVLYAGGLFSTAGGVPATRIARWDGNAWSDVGGGMGPDVYYAWVRALAVFDDGTGPALYAGGWFRSAGGVPANNVARWDGRSWHAVGQGFAWSVATLAVFDDGTGPALYAGGMFTGTLGPNEVEVNGIAKWDGKTWSPLGAGVAGGGPGPPQVRALAVFDDGSGPALYAGGNFAYAGGLPASRVAKWDGVCWSPLGSGITGNPAYVWSLEVFDDGTGPALHVGGGFYYAGGMPARDVAKWDGVAWSGVGGGLTAPVATMRAHRDGTAREAVLFVGGYFGDLGRIAKWDGRQWARLGAGTDNAVLALNAFASAGSNLQDLSAGGEFTTAGGAPANHTATYRGCLFADLDGDEDVDLADFVIFQQCYAGSGNPPAPTCPAGVDADFDDDSDVDLADFLIFQQHFTGAR